jgi:phosphatidylserine decarboxylase
MLIGLAIFVLIINALFAQFMGDTLALRGFVLFATMVIFLLVLQFFRNPSRKQNLGDGHVLCPADGKIVAIEEIDEPEYYKGKRLLVSVFMSPLNVHINRYAISGKVAYVKYHEVLYLVASHPKSSTENERHSIVISNPKVTMLVKQIAGALARRIVNYAVPGEQAKQNEELGFIKFGSRVDLLLPVGTKVNVKIGDTVKNGISVLATI